MTSLKAIMPSIWWLYLPHWILETPLIRRKGEKTQREELLYVYFNNMCPQMAYSGESQSQPKICKTGALRNTCTIKEDACVVVGQPFQSYNS